MTTQDRKKNLIEKILESKEFRKAFIEEHIYTGIPFQIQALREEKKWNQSELGEKADMAQSRISKIENPANGELNNVATLLKIAHAFQIGLMVRFAPISEILEWELSKVSPDSLQVLSFDNDPYFKEKKDEGESITANIDYHTIRTSKASDKVTYIEDFVSKKRKTQPSPGILMDVASQG